jgi:hypothetical protein
MNIFGITVDAEDMNAAGHGEWSGHHYGGESITLRLSGDECGEWETMYKFVTKVTDPVHGVIDAEHFEDFDDARQYLTDQLEALDSVVVENEDLLDIPDGWDADDADEGHVWKVEHEFLDCVFSIESVEVEPPLNWFNSARIVADPENESVACFVSIGDPRGAFKFEVRKYQDMDGEWHTVIHTPHPGESFAHVPTKQIRPGTLETCHHGEEHDPLRKAEDLLQELKREQDSYVDASGNPRGPLGHSRAEMIRRLHAALNGDQS